MPNFPVVFAPPQFSPQARTPGGPVGNMAGLTANPNAGKFNAISSLAGTIEKYKEGD